MLLIARNSAKSAKVRGVVALFVILNLSLATFMDPGIYPKGTAHEDEQVSDDFRAPLYKNVEIKGVMVRMKWCTTCQFYRPPRLVSYIPKTRTIHIDSSKVTYVAAEKDVKITVDANTANGVRHHPTVNNSMSPMPRDDYFEKGSQSLDVDPPSPPARRHLGSQNNLYDMSSGSQSHAVTTSNSTTAVGATLGITLGALLLATGKT
nr:hypothetical protein BaRGS_011919 [Batillaria attramentaria]